MRHKTIALVDWCWVGHHPTYFINFTSTLLQLGYRVLAICPNPQAVWEGVDSEFHGNLEVQSCAWKYTVRFPWALLNQIAGAARSFGVLRKQLNAWESQAGQVIDNLFFACVYDRHFRFFRSTAWGFRWKWSGLYLHAEDVRRQLRDAKKAGDVSSPWSYLCHPNVVSLAVLDEGVLDYLQQRTNKRVVRMPDIANTDVEPLSVLREEIVRRAKGRKVVSLLGYLKTSKGVDAFCQAALSAEGQKHFFVLGGQFVPSELSSEELGLIQEMRAAENVMLALRPLSEPEFNAVFLVTDVIYAAYVDFHNSSNVMTKAAYFGKPLIVSEGSLMAERCRKYSLGKVIPQSDAGAFLAAMCEIERNSRMVRTQGQDEYFRLHSTEILPHVFSELLER